jgi:hypothetical protein
MSLHISSSGRVCLCEFNGSITCSMVVCLLTHLKRTRDAGAGVAFLILQLDSNAGVSIVRATNPFVWALPAVRDCCQEFVLAIDGHSPATKQLSRILDGDNLPLAQPGRPLRCYATLDEAFSHGLALFPQNILELQRRRLREHGTVAEV